MKKIFTLFAALAMVMSMSAATLYLRGDFNSWGTTNKLDADGKCEIELKIGSYGFKFAYAYWGSVMYGSNKTITETTTGVQFTKGSNDNCALKATVAGVYTFKFNLATQTLDVTYPQGEVVEIAPTVAVLGEFNGWNTTANILTNDSENKTATTVITLTAGTTKFKVLEESKWLGDNQTITRAANSQVFSKVDGADCYLNADVAGDYTFTWTYETNTLTVTYPALPEPEPEYMDFELPINNSVFDGETMAFSGSNADYAIELSLIPDMEKPIEGEEMTFGLAAASTITREDNPMEIIEGQITVVEVETASANAIVAVKYGEDYYRYIITMTQATAETIEIELVGPAITVAHEDNILSFTSTWTYNEVEYPFNVKLNGVETLETKNYKAAQVAELKIGVDGDDDLWLDFAVANEAQVVVEEGTIMFYASFTSFASGTNYVVTIATSLPVSEPDYIDMDLNITNTVFDAETMTFIGSDDVYEIEVSLVPDMEKAIEGEEMTYGLAATSTLTFSGQDLEIIDGQIAIVDIEAPAANAIVAAKFGQEYYRFNITMTKAAAAIVEVAIEGATVAVVEATGVLNYASTWTYEEVTYPVSVRLAGYEEGKTEYADAQVAELQIGGDGDDDPWLDFAVATEADVAVEGEIITLEAYFTSYNTGTTYHVIISGDLPQGPATGVDNVNTTVAPIKVIENGQLIIINNGVMYNAQGAQL